MKNISSMAFVDGYIMVMTKELSRIRTFMLSHLQEVMEDGERYGCPAIRVCDATWLQHIEQCRAAWGDVEIKTNLR